MSDGRIIIDTEVDSSEAERGVESLSSKLESLAKNALGATEKELKNLESRLSQLDGSQVNELRNEFNQLEESVNNASEETKGLVDNLGGLVAGIGVGMGLSEVVEKSLDLSSLDTKIDISFNIPEESKRSINEAVSQVQAYGVDSEEALEGIRRQWALNSEATDEANQQTVKYASTLAGAYSGIDFTEVIQESSEVSKILSISNDEAIGLMDTLIGIGFPPDQLDIIAEYGTQLQMMGYNAEEVMGMFASGVATGTQNIDQLIDGVKEGRIVMAEFGAVIDEETATLLTNIGISTEQFQAWGQAIASGGDGGKKAMEEVATVLQNVEDKTLQNQLGTTIWGTLWEEQSTNITNAILGVNDHMLDMGGMMDTLNEKTERINADPMIKMKQAMAELTEALRPVLDVVADVVSGFASFVKENPELVAVLTVVAGAIAGIVGVCMALAPVLTVITTLAPIVAGAIGLISAPVLIVAGIIAGLIAIGVLLWQNWETIKIKATEIWNGLKEFFATTWENIKTGVTNAWENIKQIFFNTWQSIVNFFTVTVPEWINQMFNWFNELPYKIGYALGVLLGNIIKWGTDTWNYLTTNVPIWIENVVRFFSELPGKIWNWLVNAYNNIVNWGKQTYTNMVNTVSNAINSVIDWFSSLPGKIWTWLTSTIQKVSEFGYNLGSKAREAGSNLVDNIINTVTSLPGKMVEVGKSIVEGLWDGITGMWSWITNKVSGFFSGLVEGMESTLKINSPSKVIKDRIGRSMAEGVGVGFEEETKNVKLNIDSNLQNLIATMQGTVDYETAMTTARVVAHNNTLSSGTDEGSYKSKTQIPDIHIHTNIEGREVAYALAPHQDILNEYHEGR